MNTTTRRTFLQAAAAAAIPASKILGANDAIRVAVIGLGGRGHAHMQAYTAIPGCRVTAVCDVDQAALERGVAFVEKRQGSKPAGYPDMRQVFEDKNVDAVSMPLPNHWHALATIWACQAGKDVYIEKPACHNVWEGRKMVEAARKYQRMVQVGSQSRSHPHVIHAVQLLREGAIGKVYMAKGLCFKRRKSIGHKPDSPIPPGVNWDYFLGPAPMRPFNELRFKYNWHWFWDTGNGDIGNQGVHQMDIARWGLGQEGLPSAVVSTGGKFAYQDDQETPNTQLASFNYGGAELVFEVRGLLTGTEGGLAREGGNCIGNLFYGSDGYMALDGNSLQVFQGEDHKQTVNQQATKEATQAHMENFLAAMRTRNHKDLTADVAEGVTSAALCHLANISYRTGRKLAFDPQGWKFVGDAEADRMLTRDYRSPYVVPENV